jgi:hypothetical protein
MTECERLRADAPGLAALAPDDPERLAAWAHAASCEGCARALREGERLQTVLGEWSPAPLPAAVFGRAAQGIEPARRAGGASGRPRPRPRSWPRWWRWPATAVARRWTGARRGCWPSWP